MFNKNVLIPICAFYINLCTFGFMRSGGVLFMAYIQEFNCSYAQASWPTVLIGSFASFNIATAGFLSHYFEKRSIILTGIILCSLSIGVSAFVKTIEWIIFFSALQGIGNGLFVGLLPIIISEHFSKGRSIACGLSYAGSTLASFIFPPLLQFIIDNSSLQIAFITLSLIAFSATFTAWPLESRASNSKAVSEEDETKADKSLIKQIREDVKILKLFPFWTVSSIYIAFIYVFLIFVIILPDFAVERGLSKHSAVLLVSIYSIGDLSGRLIPGYLHLKNLVHNKTSYLYSIILMGSLFFLIRLYAISFLIFSIFCFALGFMSGIQMTLPAVIMVELIGIKKTTIGFGFSNILSGVIALSRPSLIDFIKQQTGNYDYLLIINAILCLLATVPWFFYSILKSNKKDEKIAHIIRESVQDA